MKLDVGCTRADAELTVRRNSRSFIKASASAGIERQNSCFGAGCVARDAATDLRLINHRSAAVIQRKELRYTPADAGAGSMKSQCFALG